jgi:hypothetical protein
MSLEPSSTKPPPAKRCNAGHPEVPSPRSYRCAVVPWWLCGGAQMGHASGRALRPSWGSQGPALTDCLISLLDGPERGMAGQVVLAREGAEALGTGS